MVKKIAVGVGVIALLIATSLFVFQSQIGFWLFKTGVAQNIGRDTASGLSDGLHVGLCGTGSPLPNPDRAGPCNVVIAGDQMYIIDMGEAGARNLTRMGVDVSDADGLLLTHFHSDHIDGLGPMMLLHWMRKGNTRPLPVHGPSGVEAVTDGFNAAYATDETYRIAHHGEESAPTSGGGAEAIPFEMTADQVTVLEKDGLTITAFNVVHAPVFPAVGYRFDYKGRSVCISGDTAKSTNLETACEGVDILVHDALQPTMVKEMGIAMEKRGNPMGAKIFFDILDYHASPEQAAESAKTAGVDTLVLSHLVPPLPSKYLGAAFLGDAPSRFDGEIVVGEDGMLFSMAPESDAIEQTNTFIM
ncbi:MAG: MBL fold metallo-hydrolase [Pseudomonadota bacterium]